MSQLQPPTPRSDHSRMTLHGYLEYSARLQKWAWLSAIIPLAIFVALIVFGTARLKSLHERVADAQTELASVQTKRDDARKELSQVEIQLKNASTGGKICGAAVADLSGSADKTQSAYKEAASKFPDAALITIQVADKSQLPQANAIAEHLRKAGYIVPPDQAIDVRGTHISRGTFLRYFFPDDKDLAQKVLDQINATGVHAELYDLSGAKDLGEIHPRQFEFRLGLNSVPAKAEPAGF